MAPNHHRSGGGGGGGSGPGGGSGGHRGHREHHSSGNRDRDRDYRSRDRSRGRRNDDRYDDRSRRDRRDREREIIQGKGKRKGGRAPDDVTILMQQDEELKNQLALVVQLEGTDGERSLLDELGEKITITCKECFRKKTTAIYIVAFILALLMLIHMCVMISKDGMPISDSSNGADSRALISLVGTVIISILAFMILNLRILNLALGLTWMFLIVSLNYNISTSLSNAAYFIYRFNHNEKQSFDNIFIFMERRYHDDYNLKDHAFIHNFLHKKRCCDFDQFKTHVNVKIPGQTAVSADYSFWDAVFQNETAVSSPKQQRRPLVCCQVQNLAGSHCYVNAVGIPSNTGKFYPTVQLTALCAKRQLLTIIKKHMLFSLAYMIVLEILSVGMALVFWYYYSDMKALEFAKQDQPGDFALLNLTVHVSESAAAAAPVETEQEKLANEKRQKRIELLKKKYGMRDGRGHGHGHGHHHGHGHGHHSHGHGHRHGGGGHGHHHGHSRGGDREHDSSRHHGHHESRHGEHGQGHSSSRNESSHHRDRDRDGDREQDRDRDRDREHHHHSGSPNRSSHHRH